MTNLLNQGNHKLEDGSETIAFSILDVKSIR